MCRQMPLPPELIPCTNVMLTASAVSSPNFASNAGGALYICVSLSSDAAFPSPQWRLLCTNAGTFSCRFTGRRYAECVGRHSKVENHREGSRATNQRAGGESDVLREKGLRHLTDVDNNASIFLFVGSALRYLGHSSVVVYIVVV